MNDRFTPSDLEKIFPLIDQYPLAWILANAQPELATPMPVLLERDPDGGRHYLLGHLPKAQPLATALTKDNRATFLFNGPHAYISPELIEDSAWAPTWNFAVVVIGASVRFDEAITDPALAKLVARMERNRAAPWSVESLGGRYQTLRSRVIGFRAEIRSVRARFKLGQDETDENFRAIVSGLAGTEIVSWMKQFR